MAERDRKKRKGRHDSTRERRHMILVVSEREVSEPKYFRGLINWAKNPRVAIEFSPHHGDPKHLVEKAKQRQSDQAAQAKRERDDNLLFDEVWCVFDVDSHERIPEAKQMAKANGIDVAISNPCFELWRVLHFQDSPGAIDRSKLPSLLRKNKVDSGKDLNFDDYGPKIEDAKRRSQKLDELAERDGEPGRNPTTGVYKLVESIQR